jgi:hypothetical protein
VTFVESVTKFDGCLSSVSSLDTESRSERFLLHASSVTETVHQMRYCRCVRHRKIGKCTESYVRIRCQVVFDSEHPLRLWKRHPCASSVWRQLTDWHERVTTWRDLHGMVYSHGELQPCISILMWVHQFYITLCKKGMPADLLFCTGVKLGLVWEGRNFALWELGIENVWVEERVDRRNCIIRHFVICLFCPLTYYGEYIKEDETRSTRGDVRNARKTVVG